MRLFNLSMLQQLIRETRVFTVVHGGGGECFCWCWPAYQHLSSRGIILRVRMGETLRYIDAMFRTSRQHERLP